MQKRFPPPTKVKALQVAEIEDALNKVSTGYAVYSGTLIKIRTTSRSPCSASLYGIHSHGIIFRRLEAASAALAAVWV